MKKRLAFTLVAIGTIFVQTFAQTQTAPEPIDHRYSFSWSDPNPPGTVVQWNVNINNPTTGWARVFVSRTLTVDCQTLLNGAPAGTYSLNTQAISALGDTSEPGTNLWVSWPGGNGKVKPGHGNKVSK